jgi:predicted dehydrogenase
MEKPMALSEGECDDLLRCARERDGCWPSGHEFRLFVALGPREGDD